MRLKTRFRLQIRLGAILLVLAANLAPSGPAHACRFWALIGIDYPEDLIEEHLRSGSLANLESLGSMNRNGWAFAAYFPRESSLPLSGPLIRRGGPPASHPTDPDYDRAVDELVDLRPRCVLGHVRAATSGLWGIPNPHPFEHAGLVFAHNGGLPAADLVDAILEADPKFFETHPPDYLEAAIDSEIYLLYLIRIMEANPGLSRTEAIVTGVREIALRFPNHRMNFVMSQGDTLWALRHAPHDESDPVRYFPAVEPGENSGAGSPYWCVASEVMGSSEERWGTLPPRHLAVFEPGRPPRFLPILSAWPAEEAINPDAGVGRTRIEAGESPR